MSVLKNSISTPASFNSVPSENGKTCGLPTASRSIFTVIPAFTFSLKRLMNGLPLIIHQNKVIKYNRGLCIQTGLVYGIPRFVYIEKKPVVVCIQCWLHILIV